MLRRDFLLAASTAALRLSHAAAGQADDAARARAWLRLSMPTREAVENFILGQRGPDNLSHNNGWKYDAELGWVLCNSVRADGVDRSKTFYHYDADGARKAVHFADRPCRVHTFGNSFTHGDQVSDGETWQEYLAAHFQEPVRNFGIGGYSVYQAYLRLRRVEGQAGAPYVILNIYDDDHYRNLDSWRPLRMGRRIPDHGTLPHLRVDVAGGRCEPVANVLPRAEDVYQLCDEDFVWRTFKDEPTLKWALAQQAPSRASVEAVAAAFGVPGDRIPDAAPAEQLQRVATVAALFATRWVIGQVEEFTAKAGKKLLVVLSYSRGRVAAHLQGKPRFDQDLVDWLRQKPYPVIDLLAAFHADYQQHKGDANRYLARYYIGHLTPAGNFFTAWALKDPLVKWLDPAPAPYR
jgi:hypothetical protein